MLRYFGNESHLKGKRIMAPQGFYKLYSYYLRQVLQKLCKTGPLGLVCPSRNLSVVHLLYNTCSFRNFLTSTDTRHGHSTWTNILAKQSHIQKLCVKILK